VLHATACTLVVFARSGKSRSGGEWIFVESVSEEKADLRKQEGL
jgi:hypothetical protein